MVSDPVDAKLIGVGFDADDELTRITRGKNYHLVGGSENTHRGMQEKCIKFNEKLDSRGKQLQELEQQEFLDIAQECKMNVVSARVPKQ